MFRNLLSSLERPCFFTLQCSAKSSSKICLTGNGFIISLALSRTTKSILRFSIGVLSCAKIALHEETIGLGTSDGSNNTPSKQCTYCVGIFTFACDDFFRFDRLRTIATNEEARTISMLSSNLSILSFIFLRWGHLSAISGVGIWFPLHGILSFAYVLGRSTFALLSSLSATRPSILDTDMTSFPDMVLRVSSVSTPSIPRACWTLVVMNVSLTSSGRE